MSVYLDTGIPGDTLLGFGRRTMIICEEGKDEHKKFLECFRLPEYNTLRPLFLYCSWVKITNLEEAE
jgi:hypothetical protein